MGEKRLIVERDVTSPKIMVAYHIPNSKSEEFYALTLLNSILSEGNSSRLYRSLVDEQQLAVQVFGFFSAAIDPTLYYIYAICAGDATADTLETAIYKEIDKIIANGVTEPELQKAKNKQLVDFYRGMDTLKGKANNLGTYEIFFGSYTEMFNAPKAFEKVTREDIQSAAKKYFIKSNRTVGVLQKKEEQSL
jgi:predicted Zn-dependent peptidase